MNEQHPTRNVDQAEIAKFEALASRWWDRAGDFRPLHLMNPLRANWIDARAPVAGRRVLDVGCGGGILSEALAQRGAEVTGIDMGEAPLAVARLHLVESGLVIDYRHASAEELANEVPASFDIVTCMEVLEHVPDPASLVRACAQLVHPGGHLFFATINRNPKSYVFAILGAEHILKLLPKGTHDYARFIRPSELAGWARAAGLTLGEVEGMLYNPITRTFSLGRDVDVNYLLHAQKPE
ncbi:MAG: bifunctional 2-polyprenyl-6-hydroxyphenol methylase/3-demethylubiquinol 3-O-methyltransferase UbiG [Pseudomonadales bacterium]|jgi:2-polyprenyl-6-hydroxyphenyl methylase/3-demethylubiquinone-9 3-methyltransferase|nr:bifunctional 2-polyprenyl-6-hydroxyphenol methylase/3-demethylubiquinol 3-O-methyltransferase UbiG [Pseudomonadales bacterium]MCP5319698.1 bifunctional 2-polyprenyl-6-hydroxyphenol methylase/3-demethylubiquinol 3-O-methyltransferase UbiG [Pseudomonadales bacterium]MCP5338354.1 bifunctional 2-polyprenyl-6-hydroxyphenol methylase/3-demethylubiquinol 3-O-methyltransferase UbiG [Pseudomonadales bacterium]